MRIIELQIYIFKNSQLRCLDSDVIKIMFIILHMLYESMNIILANVLSLTASFIMRFSKWRIEAC